MDFREIEEKWQKKWFDEKAFEPRVRDGKKKFFFTVPYPYVSGNLHVGHGRTYANGDVIVRFKRMQGYNTLWPIGFHISGTPVLAVSYKIANGDEDAIKLYHEYVGIYEKDEAKVKQIVASFSDPKKLVEYFSGKLVQDFKKMGFSLDLSRQFTTGDSEYNKFIEWQFYNYKEKNLLKQAAYPILYCTNDKNAVGEDDIKDGDTNPVEVQKFTGVKSELAGEKAFLVSATLRPDTVWGITNVFINPAEAYVKASVEYGGKKENWIVSEKSLEKLRLQGKKIDVVKKIGGGDLVGKYCITPLGTRIPILPGTFVDASHATGFVISVPAHAPYDYVALQELRADKKTTPVVKKLVEEIQLIPLINTPGFGEYPAKEISEKMKIANTREKAKLEKANQELYKSEFYGGTLNEKCGRFAGERVSDAKPKIADWLVAENKAVWVYENSRKGVVCRCGGEVVVAELNDQWFLDFNAPNWKKKSFECLEKISVTPTQYKKQFHDVFEWLDKRPCARRRGLGTQLPFANEWIIESLSDSTIYMAFYTVIKQVREHKIKPQQLSKEFFDYVFLGTGEVKQVSKKTGVPSTALDSIRTEFNYWYPNDLRHTGTAHITNHLSFFIFAHTAIFEEQHWPRGISLNELVISEGTKMSKSKGNVVLLYNVAREQGADLFRLYSVGAADFGSTLDYRKKDVEAASKSLKKAIQIIQAYLEHAKTQGRKERTTPTPLTQWAVSKFESSTLQATRDLNALQLRDYVQTAFYKQLKYFEHFDARASAEEKSLVASHCIKRWIQLLTPLIPHACEELWQSSGEKTLVSLSQWPAGDEKLVNKLSEAGEDYVESVLTDARKIIALVRKNPQQKIKSVTIVIASQAKKKLAKKLLQENSTPQELAQHEAGEASEGLKAFLEKNFFEYRTAPELMELQEETALANARAFLEQQLGASVAIEREEKSLLTKAVKAMPLKPAIQVELG